MQNRPAWHPCFAVAVVLAVVAMTVWATRDQRRAPAVAQRAELDLREGVLFRKGEPGPFTGLLVAEWRPGVRRTEVTIRAGRAHGRTRGWFENGRLEVEEHFRHGLSHGLRTRWYPDGAKKSQVTVRDGQLAGVFREWHANGRLARETPLVEGAPHGLVRSWNEHGEPAGTAQVERGRRITAH